MESHCYQISGIVLLKLLSNSSYYPVLIPITIQFQLLSYTRYSLLAVLERIHFFIVLKKVLIIEFSEYFRTFTENTSTYDNFFLTKMFFFEFILIKVLIGLSEQPSHVIPWAGLVFFQILHSYLQLFNSDWNQN